ncbi:MAG: flavoprotein [Gemmataceae bacterium]
MANILLGVTGSVAAIKTPELVSTLAAHGHTVKVLATDAALYFFDAPALGVLTDKDEWNADRYTRGDEVLHIALRKWAELFLIAPLDANTLAKFSIGLCDNALTCVMRAWDFTKPVLVAPAMNTLMWQHPFTRRHLRCLAADFGAGHLPGHLDQDQLIPLINDRAKTLRVAAPISKVLACGDEGLGAMAEVATIVEIAGKMLETA